MVTLAEWIWNPFLCVLYLLIGALFVCFTGAVAWRRALPVCWQILRSDRSASSAHLVPHTKAFFATIGATVGIGNIAGVGTAMHLGGPGALFWLWVSALLGMFFKMASTYLAIQHRPADVNDKAFATPMAYLDRYLRGSWGFVPKALAGLIAIQGIVLSNLVQSNSLAQVLHNRFDVPDAATAVVLTFFVALVVLGGLTRLVASTNAIVPWMILIYVAVGLFVLLSDPLRTLGSLGEVFTHAFVPCSVAGGAAGYAVQQAMQFGISRGIFSHMSGLGTSTFLQGANEEPPAMGAFMAALTPFVDTVIVCTITGLVILSAPFWPELTSAHLTADSFEYTLGFGGQVVVILALAIFGFTTITAMAHVSERCFKYLGGENVLGYRLLFLLMTFAGPFISLRFVWSLSDVIIAAIIVLHTIPLLYITLLNLPQMVAALNQLYAVKKVAKAYPRSLLD